MSGRESESSLWDFDIFNVDHVFTNNYYGHNNQYDINISRDPYIGDDQYPSRCNCIDCEEITTHPLQEEFSQLSIIEAPESLHTGDEYFQDSNVQDYHSHSRAHHSGYRFCTEEAYVSRPSNSYSSDGERSCDGDEYSYDLEITDELELDGEVGKRLNQMVPIPHVPRINGDIPSVDEATSDHERLLYRLQLYDLIENKVDGDGNCQFRALSDQIYRTQEHHEFVRQQVVGQLEANPEMYEGYVPMEYSEYLSRMSKSGEWGDHVTLQAAADSYGMKIFVITSYRDTCYIEILPKMQKSERGKYHGAFQFIS
ncbi:OLC1v1034525C1 [Oldenlandia corymbosa var. corymbosa]|uniref:ubiquitinyl hydrolase 1 n=1 Tax=Oldenlandia corymbosa var. corymbosa TaxID=529605 RepID=A0AAV1CS40_OLDCO|nr:OLC1v1034525C1 [Oldenlandia corymbosa var. corymbosa]